MYVYRFLDFCLHQSIYQSDSFPFTINKFIPKTNLVSVLNLWSPIKCINILLRRNASYSYRCICSNRNRLVLLRRFILFLGQCIADNEKCRVQNPEQQDNSVIPFLEVKIDKWSYSKAMIDAETYFLDWPYKRWFVSFVSCSGSLMQVQRLANQARWPRALYQILQ